MNLSDLYLRCIQRLATRLITKADARAPDFEIPNDKGLYLRRWWLLPRNPLLNVYLHEIVGDDEDRALHDHPWPSLSLTLSGVYLELVPIQQTQDAGWDFIDSHTERHARVSGDWVWRSARLRHRLLAISRAVLGGQRTFTLFVTGPVVREWGFHCRSGWVPWRHFVASDDKGRVGAGCAGASRKPLPWWRLWRGEEA